MSFTDEVKQELIHRESGDGCCQRAEICAAVLLSGALSFRGKGRYGISMSLSRVSASRYYYSLIKRYLGVSAAIRTKDVNRLGVETQVELGINDEDVPDAMEKLMLFDENALFGVSRLPKDEILLKPCCKAAFLKSAFIVNGTASNPEREYALNIAASSEEMAERLRLLTDECGIRASVSKNRSRFIICVKSAEGVSDFLTLIGAHSAMLRVENVRIMKEIKNSANRRANCDGKNIERAVQSSYQQTEDIRFLAMNADMDKMPAWAKEIMSLRLENPDSTLTELGEMCDPPIGKSGVNNRLRRISRMAEELRSGD